MTDRRTSIAITGLLLMAISADNSAANEDVAAILRDVGEQCTAMHGYDWRNPGDIGQSELAPGEKAWRDCVYAGIRRDVIPRSAVPEDYERIIAEDQQFTRAIEAGTMTRDERWQRNKSATDAARAKDSAVAATKPLNKTKAADVQQQKAFDQLVKGQLNDMLRNQTRPHYMR